MSASILLIILYCVSIDVCTLPASVGPCRAYVERWFYDATKSVCEPFGFTGCGGNANNFPTEEECHRKCKGITKVATTTDGAVSTAAAVPAPDMSTKKVKITQSPADNEVLQNDAPGLQDVDCEVGPWLGWSNCFGECNFAIKVNYRRIVRHNSGSGKKCPKLIKSRTCTLDLCKHTFTVTRTPNDDFDIELHYDDD